MSDLKDYPASVFLSGTLGAWAFVTLPLIAVLAGVLLAAFAVAGLGGFGLLGLGGFYFAAGILVPVTMLFSWFGAVLLCVLVWALFTFWRDAARRAEALLVICLAIMLHCCIFAGGIADDMFFWLRAPLAAAIPIAVYFYVRWLPVIRARRHLAQLDEDADGIDDDEQDGDGWTHVPPSYGQHRIRKPREKRQ